MPETNVGKSSVGDKNSHLVGPNQSDYCITYNNQINKKNRFYAIMTSRF